MAKQTVSLDPAVYGLTGAMNVTVDHQPDGNGGNGGNGGEPLTQARFNEMLQVGLTGLPPYPDSAKVNGKVDPRDISFQITHGNAVQERLSEYPFPLIGEGNGAPPIIHARTGEADITQAPFNAKSGTDCTKAIEDAVDAADIVYIPPGNFKCAASLPADKSWQLKGASRFASNLVGLPGRDIIHVDRGNKIVQRRVARANHHEYRDIGFWLNTDRDHRADFNRKTASGWRAAHACIAYHEGSRGEGKHDAWCNSYGEVSDCLFSQNKKGHHGGTAIYFGSTHYGWTFDGIYIGEHGSNIAGTAGGIIDGLPSWGAENTELSSDSNYYHNIRHWNPELSLSLVNQGNSSIGNVEIYHQSYRALEVLGVTSANRKMPRDLSMYGSFYNDNELDDPDNAPGNAHVEINCEGTAATSCMFHLKRVRQTSGNVSPVILLGGYGFSGRFKLQSSQTNSHNPIIRATGNHHRLEVDAAGFTPAALAAMKDDLGSGNQWDIKRVT